MSIQLGNFVPLQHKHYQLAETQSEKDAAAGRQAELIAQQGLNSIANTNAHAAASIAMQNNQLAEQGRQANMHDELARDQLDQQSEQQAIAADQNQQRIDQQGQQLANQSAIDQQKLNLGARELDAKLAQNGIENQLMKNKDAREQTQFDQAQEDKKQADELKQLPLAMAKFGHYLTTAEPDKDGMVDVTDQKDNIKTMVGGFGDQDFKRITAQNAEGKTKLFGYTDDNKAVPLTRNGNPVAISNAVLQQQALFAGGDSKTQKAQAELKQTELENQQKQAELDYMTKNGAKMGTAGQEKQNITISTNQLGGSNILNKDNGMLTVTDPKGKIISQSQIPGVGSPIAAQGIQPQPAQSSQKMTAQQAYQAALSAGDKGRAERIKQYAIDSGDW